MCLTLDHLCFQNINGFVGLILVGGEIWGQLYIVYYITAFSLTAK